MVLGVKKRYSRYQHGPKLALSVYILLLAVPLIPKVLDLAMVEAILIFGYSIMQF
jgi:hypothetical protein